MEPKKKKIAILVPCTEFGPNTFWLNFIPMRDRIMKQGWQITTVLDMSSYPIDIKREMMTERALNENVDYLLWLDADMVYPMDLLDQLFLEPPVMVTALIHKKVKPFWPTIYLKQKNPETKKVEYLPGFVDEDDTGFRKIDVCGFAAVLIPAFYFREMKRPWFKIIRRTYKNAKIIGEDFWYCFSDDKNYVFTSKNLTKIKDVQIGDEVTTHLGSNRVHEIFCRDYDGDMVNADAHYSTIKTTPNHPILTKRGWIPADELSKEDYVFYPIPEICEDLKELNLNEFNHKTEYDNKLKWKCGSEPNYLPEIVNIDVDLSYLLGILIAEGYISRQSTITMHKNEIGIINKCQQILLDKLNQKSSHKLQGNTLHLVTTSKPLYRFLSKEIGEGARNKHLPTFWASLSKENLASLLRGYFDGDGHIVDKHSYSATTVSEMLARQIQEALIRLGILSSLRKKEHTYCISHGERKECGVAWIITIPTCFRKEFLKILYNKEYDKPFTGYGSVEKTKEGFWVKIKKLNKEHYTGKVYNLSVLDDNSYIVNGIAVHNCKKVRKMGLPILVNLDCKVRHGFGDATGFEGYMYFRSPKRQDNVYKDDYIKRLDRRVDQLEEQIDTGKLIGQETGRIPDNRQESKVES